MELIAAGRKGKSDDRFMNYSDFKDYVQKLPRVTSANSFGYDLFFFGDEQMTPFVSMADSDNDYDDVSDLNREGVFRLNIGVSAESYQRLFPEEPTVVDYKALNVFLPHPHYAAQKFICILNPIGPQLEQTLEFIAEAYEIAKRRSERKATG